MPLSMRAFAPALVLLAAPLCAQTRVVPLDEALGIARAQTIDVLRADAQVQSARVAVDAAGDRRWPALSLSAGGGQRYGLAFDQTSGGLTQATVESVDIGLNAEFVVFDGFERRAAARAATAGLRDAELDRARAEQEATVAVLLGYLAVAQAEAARIVATENVAAQRDLLSEVQAQVDLGERPAVEVSQQQERVASAESAVIAANRDRAIAEALLVRILGLDPMAEFDFTVPTEDTPPSVSSESDAVRQALERRLDLQAASAAVSAAEDDRRAARASRLPQVTLGGYVGTSYTSAAQDVGIPGQFGDNRSGSLRVGISLPVLDRGLSRQRVRLADARIVALRAEQDDARRAVVLEVQERQIELEALQAQATVAEIRVQAADAALAAERTRYSAGTTTLQSVSLLQARSAEARSDQQRLAIEMRFQYLLLGVAMGN